MGEPYEPDDQDPLADVTGNMTTGLREVTYHVQYRDWFWREPWGFLQQCASQANVSIQLVEEQAGWLRTKIRASITGLPEEVKAFLKIFNAHSSR